MPRVLMTFQRTGIRTKPLPPFVPRNAHSLPTPMTPRLVIRRSLEAALPTAPCVPRVPQAAPSLLTVGRLVSREVSCSCDVSHGGTQRRLA